MLAGFASFLKGRESCGMRQDLQCGHHVTGRDAVHAHAGVRPLHGQRGCHVSDSSFRSVIRCLRLGDVDDRTAHGADHDNTAGLLAFHEMLSNTNGKQPGAVDIHAPQFLHAVVRVVDGGVVFCETGGSHQVVDFAVLGDDFVES